MTSADRLVFVKRQIKEWEKLFERNNGVPPLKRDIVDNATIHQLYREYKQIRYGKQESRNHHKKRSTAAKEQVDWSFLVSDDEGEDSLSTSSPQRFRTKVEIGPTPQASGRILSIFDFKPTPPESSPLKNTGVLGKPEVHTPSKSRVKNILDGDDQTPTKTRTNAFAHPQMASSPSKNTANTPMYLKRSLFTMEGMHNGSPEKRKAVCTSIQNISPLRPRAPSVFNNITPTKTTPNVDFSISPSPFKAHRSLTKKLSDIFNDSKSLVSELEVLGETLSTHEEEENEDGEARSDEDDQTNANETETPFRVKKAKTQKRSTRRWKIRPAEMDSKEDTLASTDIHQQMELLEQQEITNIKSGMISDNDGNDQDDEEVDLEKELSINITESKRKYVTQNYKRLKINHPGAKAFKRRMGRH